MPKLLNSFRARLVLLLVVLLGLTLGVQYYVNLRSVRSNAHLIVEQEQAIMAGVALGVSSINSKKYLDQMRTDLREPVFDENTGRVKNILLVDSEGAVQDSLVAAYSPSVKEDGTKRERIQLRESDTPIVRHIKIKAGANPHDPRWEPYFEARWVKTMLNSGRGRSKLYRVWLGQDRNCHDCRQRLLLDG